MKARKTIKRNIGQLPLATLILLWALGIFSGCYYDNKEDLYQYVNTTCDTTQVSYQNDIVSILQAQCLSCHSQDNALGGGIFLATYTQVKTRVTSGSFYGSVAHQGAYSAMPPTGQQIPACQLATIKSWIDAGAPEN